VFTPDEEIGEGTLHIDPERLGRFGYTLDGGEMGEIEDECFDAFECRITFFGRNIHPGEAKDRMINAGAAASRFVSALPEYETPEHTESREGFFHLTGIQGAENEASIRVLIRDFDPALNERRLSLLRDLAQWFEMKYHGLRIRIETTDQYNNMKEILDQYPEVVEKARQAVRASGLEIISRPIRGGTDGARLSFMGCPMPNLFAGGMMVHSRTEWIPETALGKAAEVILHLCRIWTL
jgi:tripeptide aminopeptidase